MENQKIFEDIKHLLETAEALKKLDPKGFIALGHHLVDTMEYEHRHDKTAAATVPDMRVRDFERLVREHLKMPE